MPLRKENTRTFHRTLYAGQLETVELLKRDNDQREGVVTSYLIFNARRGQMVKTGEPIQGDMSSNHSTTWHIPASELERVGVEYINAADRFVDKDGWWWQPESTTSILVKLFTNWINVNCLRINPPKDNIGYG